MFSAAAWREPERAVQSYAADDDAAGDMAADMIRADGYEPVRMGGLDESIRIEMARPSGCTSTALAVRRQLRRTSPIAVAGRTDREVGRGECGGKGRAHSVGW